LTCFSDGTEEQLIRHVDHGHGKLETEIETIKKDKNGNVISRNTEKYEGRHIIMI
jgi:hypothetical protein